jgi:hypothetical protein
MVLKINANIFAEKWSTSSNSDHYIDYITSCNRYIDAIIELFMHFSSFNGRMQKSVNLCTFMQVIPNMYVMLQPYVHTYLCM